MSGVLRVDRGNIDISGVLLRHPFSINCGRELLPTWDQPRLRRVFVWVVLVITYRIVNCFTARSVLTTESRELEVVVVPYVRILCDRRDESQ